MRHRNNQLNINKKSIDYFGIEHKEIKKPPFVVVYMEFTF